MTTTEAIAAKRQLEADILRLIGDYERTTKTTVKFVTLETVRELSGRKYVTDLRVEAVL